MSPLPQTISNIKNDLDSILSHLINRSIADDYNFPYVRQSSSDKWEVSYKGAENVSIGMADIEYADIYRELVDKRSYCIKLIDGGLLQLLYLFEDDRLVRHRLAYYPSPNLQPFQDDPEGYLQDEIYLDIIWRRIVPFPLRFDFDESKAEDIRHPACHLTLGDVRGCRIPVSAPLTPRWFIEFIIRNFYNTDSHDLTDGMPPHRHHFEQTIAEPERELIHIAIPAGP